MHSLHKAQLALQRIQAISSPSAAVVRWLELSLVDAPSLKDIAALVRSDPGLAIEVLRRRKVDERKRKYALNLTAAVEELGVAELRELALRSDIRQPAECPTSPTGPASTTCTPLSRAHALACATAAMEIARQTHYPEPEHAYCAGLLSSIGLLALHDLYECEWREFGASIVGQDLHHLLELEREAFGLDHENVGVVLCEVWNLPFELHDLLAAQYRSIGQVERAVTGTVDAQLVSVIRAAQFAAQEAGFPLISELKPEAPPADVARLFDGIDLQSLLETLRAAVTHATALVAPGERRPEEELHTMLEVNRELKSRLMATEQRLRAEVSVNNVLQYGLRRLGDGDPLPGVMFHAMESIGFRRICCLELNNAESKLEVSLSAASSGVSRVAERIWIPFPTDKGYLSSPTLISRNDGVAAHQLVLELVGVSSAVLAPLQELTPGKRQVLCADRGSAGSAPVPGEERALGIIADQASLLMKYEQLSREKERMATQDPLTGAATRRRMMERLEFLISQCERTRMPFSLLIMDLDHFKKFNDTMGHQTGDRLLQDLVKLLGNAVRKGDLVARYGGEEFVVLLANCDSVGAATVAEDLRSDVFKYGLTNLETYRGMQVSISMGAAQWQPGESALALIGRADAALYEAKHGGRNQVKMAA